MKREVLIGAALAALALGGSAQAAVTEIDIGINPTYEQTGPTTIVSTGGFFSARADLASASDFDGGSLTYPGPGSPATLTPASGPILTYAPPSYATLSALNTAFPTGTYTFEATNSSTAATQVNSLDYLVSADSNMPMLTAASYQSLDTLSAGGTISFNTMVENPNANYAEIFLSIYDSSSNSVYSTSTFDLSADAFTIPAGLLASGQSYTLDLLFDDRITGFDGSVPTTIFFDTHTGVSFSTAVPEPSTWALALGGLAAAGAMIRRRRTAILTT